MYAFGLLKLRAVGSEANCADSCTATGTSVAAAAAAITAANASRCLRLDGSNVIRHSREPGRQQRHQQRNRRHRGHAQPIEGERHTHIGVNRGRSAPPTRPITAIHSRTVSFARTFRYRERGALTTTDVIRPACPSPSARTYTVR